MDFETAYPLFKEEAFRHMSALAEDFQSRLDVVIDHLKGHDDKFDVIDKRFDQIDQRFDTIDLRFEKVDQRFENIENRLDSHQEMIGTLLEDTEMIKSSLTEVRKELTTKAYKRDLHAHEKRIKALEHKMA